MARTLRAVRYSEVNFASEQVLNRKVLCMPLWNYWLVGPTLSGGSYLRLWSLHWLLHCRAELVFLCKLAAISVR